VLSVNRLCEFVLLSILWRVHCFSWLNL